MKNLIKINSLTYILILLFLLGGYFKYLCMILIIMCVHELGHIFFMVIFKRKITNIYILPTGGLTFIDSYISTPIKEDILIALGGVFFQSLFGLMFSLSGDFYYYNRLIILFNLLPIYPLDGFNFFRLILEVFMPFKTSLKLSMVISLIFTIILFKSFNFNILMFLFLIVMQYKEYKSHKYLLNRFYLERLNNSFTFKKIKHINKVSSMYKNKTNILNGEDEHTFLKQYFYNH